MSTRSSFRNAWFSAILSTSGAEVPMLVLIPETFPEWFGGENWGCQLKNVLVARSRGVGGGGTDHENCNRCSNEDFRPQTSFQSQFIPLPCYRHYICSFMTLTYFNS